MKKDLRQRVFEKYGGLCAYTGNPLGDDWQIDHMVSKQQYILLKHGHPLWHPVNENFVRNGINDFNNLMPTCRIINHYKRDLCLEGFRRYMCNFHKRLAKLPKNTRVLATQKRKEYLHKVAELFNITPENPFSGKFYFETT